jgi:hypothetical protein
MVCLKKKHMTLKILCRAKLTAFLVYLSFYSLLQKVKRGLVHPTPTTQSGDLAPPHETERVVNHDPTKLDKLTSPDATGSGY